MLKNEWIRCPVCGSKTRDRLREDTVLKNYPLYCPKCKQDTCIICLCARSYDSCNDGECSLRIQMGR